MTTLAIDGTGSASANLITGESSSVNTVGQLSDSYLFLQNGLFYGNSLQIQYTPTSGAPRTLVKGVDYDVAFAIKGVVANNVIYGAIRLINTNLAGTLATTYQALGGVWNLLQSTIQQFISTHAINPNVAYFALTPQPPLTPQGASAPLVLNSLQAVELAQLLSPSGVGLTVTIQELSEAEQYVNYSSNSNSSGNNMSDETNYALETGGNLQSAAQSLATIAAAQGAQSQAASALTTAATELGTAATALASAGAGAEGATTDTAYTGSGAGSMVSILKGNFSKLASLVSQFPSSIGQKTAAASLSVTLPSDQGPLVTTGAAGAPLALDSSIQALINAVKGTISIDGSVWVDVTVSPAAYYIRRETFNETANAYVVTWETVAGVTATPTVGNLQAVGQGATLATENMTYVATASGTGYSTNDLLMHTYGVDTSTNPATIQYSLWFNMSTGSVLVTAPTNGSFTMSGGSGSSSVTVTASTLPTNAAQEAGGNLAAIAAAQGTIADGAFTGAGNAGMISLLKGLYAKLAGVLNIRALTSADVVTANIGTTNGLALDSSVQSLINAIHAQQGITDVAFYDDTVNPVTWFIRRETINQGTGNVAVSWFNLDGSTASPTLVNLKSAGDAQNLQAQNLQFIATASGTGYAANDTLIHAYAVDRSVNPPVIAYSYWLNGTQGTILSTAPNSANYTASSASTVTVTSSALPANAAQESGGNLAALYATAGTTADGAWSGSGASTMIAALKAIWTKLGGTLTTTVSSLPALASGTNTIGAVTGAAGAALALDSSIQTLINTIKATTDITGSVWFDPTVNPPVYFIRRETVNEGTGNVAVSWFTPGGSVATPTVGNLQAVGDTQSLQAENVNYTATSSGTGYTTGDLLIHAYAIDRAVTGSPTVAYNFWLNATQATVLSGPPTNGTYTNAVTPTLPTNAAQETGGNLAAVAAAQGTTADTAYTGSGNASIISILKGIWANITTKVTYELGSDGTLLPIDSLAQTLSYTSNVLQTVQVSYNGHTYVKTLGYDGSGNMNSVSVWQKTS